MTPTLILDCSIAMAWCFEDEETEATNEIQDRLIIESAVVPSVWPLEVVNVLTISERKKRIESAKSQEFVELLFGLKIQLDILDSRQSFHRIPPLCRTHSLTSYDAAYLELALRTRLPLASLDSDLRRAASKLGIPLLGR